MFHFRRFYCQKFFKSLFIRFDTWISCIWPNDGYKKSLYVAFFIQETIRYRAHSYHYGYEFYWRYRIGTALVEIKANIPPMYNLRTCTPAEIER